jgi:hypothetical protein
VTVLLDGYSPACLLGSAWLDDGEVAVYDGDAIVAELMTRDGMEPEDAREWVEFNIEGARMEAAPVIVWRSTREEIEARAGQDEDEEATDGS